MVLSMERWIGKVAVVTGASKGIGAAISERLVEEGVHVVGLARNRQPLDDLAKNLSTKKGRFYPLGADISKEQDILDAFVWIRDNLGPVHILVNNAAVGGLTSVLDGNVEDWLNTFKVNVIGLCTATRETVKNMNENNVDGHIININSMMGHFVLGFPGFEMYTASKHAVTALGQAMRKEMGNSRRRIKFTSLSPGATDTDFIEPGTRQMIKMDSSVMLKADDVADAAAYVLSTPPHVQIHELMITHMNETC
ncbi:unnamed protein product [Acanthoscelides obtectus]|uniref:Farnesol dehydrogenase-like n=1 Tax=Acanthoscelides obtectus TaxID=200917 RepID=A0A9P0L7D5_ACAOB|nr:unnamed protein product [Acanthoscelides obtectus]CAK1663168.1 Farnesol dehydrogenase [Acanthoscelides obtectus]